jgi:hypothetical protein
VTPDEPQLAALGHRSSWRTATAVCVAVVAIAAVAIATGDIALTGIVAGFAGTALGFLTQRHTSEDLYASTPARDPPP